MLSIVLVLVVTAEYVLGQCDHEMLSRSRCRASTKVGCLVANCCYDDDNEQCYRKATIVGLSFKPTASTGSRNTFLQVGGEPGYRGNWLIRTCVPNNFRRCGPLYPPMTEERCVQNGCCWNGATSRCVHARHFIIRQRTNCPPGFTGPPTCRDTDECASNPCKNNGVCSNNINGYSCTCPTGVTGTNCQNVCPRPANVAFGSFTPDAAFYDTGTILSFTCNSGYLLSGSTMITCQASRIFSPSPPTCVKVCGAPPAGTGVTYTPTGTTFNIGQRVTYSCGSQAVIGPTTNDCLAGGVWSSTTAPTCNACTPPPEITNGIYTTSKPSYGVSESVTYSCATGYTLVGNAINQCQTGNVWSQTTAPVCNAAVCPVVPALQFGSFSPTLVTTPNIAVGSSATYTCNTGYSLSGSATINCVTGPQWNFPNGPTSCIQDCGTPPSIASPGTQPPASVPYINTETALYSCPTTYVVTGTNPITCTSGAWVPNTAPSCTKVCGVPPPITTNPGTVTAGTQFNIGAFATYTCTGATHNIIGFSTNECLTGGTWKNAAPECKAECPKPVVANAAITPTGASIAMTSSYTFACAAGYTPKAGFAATLTCPTATTAPPTITVPAANVCEKNCPAAPAAATNGNPVLSYSTVAVSSLYSPGTTATYTCNTGFLFPSGTSGILTCQADGTWSPTTAPVCQMACTAPPSSANLQAAPSAATHAIGATVTYSCASGFNVIPQTSVTSTCQAGNTWSVSTAPTCQAVCITPPLITTGSGDYTPKQTTYTATSAVTYTCNTNFNLVGSMTITCTAGTFVWSPAVAPVCAPDCPAFPAAGANSNVKSPAPTAPFTNNEMVTYECTTGFVTADSLTLTCTSTGAWNPATAPICRKVCGNAPNIAANGAPVVPLKAQYEVNEQVSYSCTGTFNVRGTTTNKCKADGTWEYTTPPTCEAVCYAAPSIANGDYTPKNAYTNAGTSVTYSCISNDYILSGAASVMCSAASLTWATAPSCLRVCTAPPKNANSIAGSAVSWKAGDTITYTCDPNYKLVVATSGNNPTSENECLATGLWKYTVAADYPTCTGVCGAAPTPTQGTATSSPTGTQIDVGTSITYTCTAPTPANIVGTNPIQCTAPGVYTPTTAPQCKSVCINIPQIVGANGNPITGVEWAPSTSVTYTCIPTYLPSFSTNMCQTALTWSKTTGPTCLKVCAAAVPTGNGGATFAVDAANNPLPANNVEGTKYIYSCPSGMAIAVGGSADTTCTNGAWSNQGPTCVPACSAPPTSAVGAATATPNNPNNPETTQVTYTCATGTSLVGTAQITCLSTRLWSPAVAPDCVTNCPSPPSIPFNGAANAPATGPYIIGFTVTYSCLATFTLTGPTTNMCTRTGTAAAGAWSGAAPTCIKACPDPPAIQANGAPNVPAVGPYNFNAEVAYSCVATHALQGTTPNVCEDKNGVGTWKSAAPNCLLKCTNAPPALTVNGNTVLDGAAGSNPVPGMNVEGTKYNYVCAATYTIAAGGATDTTCTNGAWSNPIPTCVPACTAPPASAVGAATATPNNPSNPQTTQVTYTCPAGTSLVGTATITCQATRVWSPAVAPDCVTDCQAPPAIAANGAANVPAVGPYKIGTTVTYSCAANFDLKGSATNMCQRVGAAAAGTWTSTTAPTCVTADKDLDIVFILDGNNPLDDCTTKTSSTPVLAGPLLTAALFPNFFIQQALAAGIEAQWNTVNQGNTRIGYQMHAGVCDFASSTNLHTIKTLSSLSSTINLLSGQAYRCSTTNNPVKVVQCAQAVQFVSGRGDRPTIPNVIILVMHDTQKYTAAERATFLTEMAAARASLTGTLMITTALPPIDPNFSANEQYIRMLLACPATGSCLPFLGTMSNTANVVSNLKLATAGL